MNKSLYRVVVLTETGQGSVKGVTATSVVEAIQKLGTLPEGSEVTDVSRQGKVDIE